MELQIFTYELLQKKILLIGGRQVMLGNDLAGLYGVKTKVLIQAVKRNIQRFPEDFMFKLSIEEFENWKSQIVTSNSSMKMGLRKAPYAFTEQGVAMLSSVLRSDRAVKVNIAIMRTFVHLRKMLASHEEFAQKLEEMENSYDEKFAIVFETIRQMIREDNEEKGPIGFKF